MSNDTHTSGRGERSARYLALAVAVIAIALAGWGAADRLAEVAPGRDVEVLVPLTHDQGDWLFGELMARADASSDAGDLAVGISSVAVSIAEPSATMLIAMWADPIVGFLALAAGAVVAAKLIHRVALGRFLQGDLASLVLAGAGIAAAGWAAHAMLSYVITRGASASLFDGTRESGPFATDLTPVAWILLLVAVGIALQVGERLRRETDGLV